MLQKNAIPESNIGGCPNTYLLLFACFKAICSEKAVFRIVSCLEARLLLQGKNRIPFLYMQYSKRGSVCKAQHT